MRNMGTLWLFVCSSCIRWNWCGRWNSCKMSQKERRKRMVEGFNGWGGISRGPSSEFSMKSYGISEFFWTKFGTTLIFMLSVILAGHHFNVYSLVRSNAGKVDSTMCRTFEQCSAVNIWQCTVICQVILHYIVNLNVSGNVDVNIKWSKC